MNNFVLFGHIIHTPTPDTFSIRENSFLVCENGLCAGIFDTLPEKYQSLPLQNYENQLIIPALYDLHVHAPQYAFRGLGMDMELLDWLNAHAFTEEQLYADREYADKAYTIFAEDLKNSPTARAVIFGTVHTDATLLLMDKLEQTGLQCLVGKVNMDRNAPEALCEGISGISETRRFLDTTLANFQNTKPILTPRFLPSCTDELMKELSNLRKEYNLPVQSHLSENKGEIAWVKELCPWSEGYGDAYDKFEMFGGTFPTIMAHCVHSDEKESALMKKNGVIVAHCPSSNFNLSSGIAPIRSFLNQGITVGLGTDIGAGYDISIFRAMTDAVQVSKLKSSLWEENTPNQTPTESVTSKRPAPITLSEAFYMGTKAASAVFGNIGSFEENVPFDALVLDDSSLTSPRILSVRDRIERAIYLEKQIRIVKKYVSGTCIF